MMSIFYERHCKHSREKVDSLFMLPVLPINCRIQPTRYGEAVSFN